MAAPTSAYFYPTLNTFNNVLTVHQRAIPTDVKAILQARFFLDEIVPTIDIDGNISFNGVCYIGSYYYNYHNPSRIGSLRYKQDGVFFWDAGLNTRPNPQYLSANNIEAGVVNFHSEIYSAYYVNTSSHGYDYRIWNGSSWGLWGGFAIFTDNINAAASKIFDFGNFPMLNAGLIVQVRAWAENVEGRTYDPSTLQFAIEPRTISVKYSSAYASSAVNLPSDNMVIYVNTAELTDGMRFFTDKAMTVPAPDGYYAFDGSWYNHRFTLETGYQMVVSHGIYGSYDSTDPATPPTYNTYSWSAFDNGSSGYACAISGVGSPSATNTFRSASNLRHYLNTALTDIAADGYYTFRNDSAVYEWVQIIDGFEVDSGSC